MPKAVLFQGVNKFVRHEKGPNQYGPGLIELEVMSQAVGLAKVALEQAGESLAVAGLVLTVYKQPTRYSKEKRFVHNILDF